MPRRTYDRQQQELFDALFRLIASCARLVATDVAATGLSPPLRERLDRVSRELRVLASLAQIIADWPWQRERSSIRCGRCENIAEIHTKPIPVIGDGEQPGSDQCPSRRMHLSDLLFFPAYSSPEPGAPSNPVWPRLAELRLSPERIEVRNRGIGGSDANVILSGDDERILRLWREKRGESPPEDLSGRLSVMLGSWTEAFNRQWFEKVSGKRVVDAGLQLTCKQHRWRNCTLDGMVELGGAVFEAKHTNAFSKPEDVLERYMPQLQHNMAVANADRAILSVIFGNAKYEMFEVAADWLYQLDLLNAEKRFWSAVLSGEPPVALAAPPAPLPVATRELSFDGNNAWASAAADWLEHSKAAKAHASACRALKELIDEDVKRAFGHGIEAKRNKSGAVTIRELA